MIFLIKYWMKNHHQRSWNKSGTYNCMHNSVSARTRALGLSTYNSRPGISLTFLLNYPAAGGKPITSRIQSSLRISEVERDNRCPRDSRILRRCNKVAVSIAPWWSDRGNHVLLLAPFVGNRLRFFFLLFRLIFFLFSSNRTTRDLCLDVFFFFFLI